MSKFYVYCENHGRIEGKYNNSNEASKRRKEHLINVSPPHGKVDVIEEMNVERYGQMVVKLRKYHS